MLTELQTAICAYLNGDAWFATVGKVVSVLPEDKQDLVQEISNALAGIGVCVIVSTPKMVVGEHNHQVNVSVVLSVIESPLMNRASSGTGRTAGQISEHALACMLLTQIGGDSWTPLELIRMEMAGATEQGQLIWELEMRTSTNLSVSAEPVPPIG